MKRTLIALSFVAIILSSCGAPETKEVEVIEEETVMVDSAAVEMHKTTQEIEKTTEELEALLNEI